MLWPMTPAAPNRAIFDMVCLPSSGGMERGRSVRPAGLEGEPAMRGSMPLEELDLALVLHRRFARREGAQVAALAGRGVGLARIEPVFTGRELADHGGSSDAATPGDGEGFADASSPPLS